MGKPPAEEEEPVPERLRCKRTDGRKWRCRRQVMGNLKLCKIHYLQGRLHSHKEKVPDSLKLQRKKKHNNNHIAADFKNPNNMNKNKKKPELENMEGEGEVSCAVDITGYNLESRICKLETLIAKLKAAKFGSKV